MQQSPYGIVKSEILESIAAALQSLKYKTDDIESTIISSQQFGDISCSVAFRLAKSQKKSPKEVAENIATAIKKPDSVSKITVENCFINFHLERKAFAKRTLSYAINLSIGAVVSDAGANSKAIIEYPSANPAHPLHVGQVRSALLGDCLSNVHEACGYKVEREDYIDDRGLQATQALWGTMNKEKLGIKPDLSKKFDHALGDAYVAANKYFAEHKETEEDVKKLMELIEEDGTYESKLSREQAEEYVKAERETLFSYKMYHDIMVWESDVIRAKLLSKALEMLDNKGVLEKPTDGKYSGCTIIALSKIKNLPKELQGAREEAKVLLRSNGTPTYLAKDIAFHMWKFGLLDDTFNYTKFMAKQPNGKPLFTTGEKGSRMEFGRAQKAVNLIDARQSAEQLMIKVVFDVIGENKAAEGFNHLAYGLVELESGALAGRKGTWLGFTADDLLREATEKALTLIRERFKGDKGASADIASNVAIGAIKFEFLKMSPEKVVVFSWKNALNFEGISGPYCQYTYARAMRMIEDSGFIAENAAVDPTILVNDSEFALFKKMSMLKEISEKTCAELRPNVLTEYCGELALAFSKFYESVPVLKAASEQERLSRLALTLAFANTLKYALAMLGISAVKRM